MPTKPVIVLGAGATKACGGPLTRDILPAALNGKMADGGRQIRVDDREELLALTSHFLSSCFNVPPGQSVQPEDCPSLPMVLSMLRRSVDSDLPLGRWSGNDLVKAKRAIEYGMFAVIEATLRTIPDDRRFHSTLLEPLYRNNIEPAVVSLNYDVIVDNAMFALADAYRDGYPPDYRTTIETDLYNQFCHRGTFGLLLKIHGSLNWMYCERCERLDLFVSEGMKNVEPRLRTGKALDDLYDHVPFDDAYSCQGTPCRNADCDGFVTPVLITPTYVKDYENPHIADVWKEAEAAMQAADRAVIIGYSLPTDDVEVAMLFKRGLDHLDSDRITVVEYVHGDAERPTEDRAPLEHHPTGQRFRSLFGSGLDWHTTGFAGWLGDQEATGGFPFDGD